MTATATDTPLLAVQSLARSFGRFRALTRVDLQVRDGESVALFGGNGAGKTTLLKIIATLLGPTRGSLAYRGKPVKGAVRRAYRRALGFAGHATFLYGDLSAEENLMLHARLRGVERPEERVRELLERVDLWERRNERPTHFSRGMQQRASLARAMIDKPSLLLLDEPFSGLDTPGAAVIEQEIRQHRAAGLSTLIVSHNLPRALSLCDRYVALERGQVVQEGPCAPFRDLPPHEVNLERILAGTA
mgnify:CR=1 FL=1